MKKLALANLVALKLGIHVFLMSEESWKEK